MVRLAASGGVGWDDGLMGVKDLSVPSQGQQGGAVAMAESLLFLTQTCVTFDLVVRPLHC